MAKVISISNTKGGTGKSTVTILLASALALQDKKKVLVLDCDNQNSIAHLRQLELADDEKEPYTIETVAPKFVHEYLKLYSAQYDFIFLDLPRITDHTQSEITYGLLSRCDFLFIPIIAAQFDTLSTLAFLEGVKEVSSFKEQQKIPFKFYGFLNQKERRKDNETVLHLMEENELPMLKESLSRLKIFKDVSTMENPLSSTQGKERFKPFYKEIKKIIK